MPGREFRPLKRQGLLTRLLQWENNNSWLDVPLYVLWFTTAGIGFWLLPVGIVAGSPAVGVVATTLLFIGGALWILLSRPLGYGREDTPLLWRMILEGWGWGNSEYGPYAFRIVGSLVCGVALGKLLWMLHHNIAMAVVVGLVGFLVIWVWTWFAFDEMEEEP